MSLHTLSTYFCPAPHRCRVKVSPRSVSGTPQLPCGGRRPAPRVLAHSPRSPVTGSTRPCRGGSTGSPRAWRNTPRVKPFAPGGHEAVAGPRAGGTSEQPAFPRTSASPSVPLPHPPQPHQGQPASGGRVPACSSGPAWWPRPYRKAPEAPVSPSHVPASFVEEKGQEFTCTAWPLVPLRCSCVRAQSRPTLCDPWTVTIRGRLQSRVLETVAVSFSRGSSRPTSPVCPALAGGFFTTGP